MAAAILRAGGGVPQRIRLSGLSVLVHRALGGTILPKIVPRPKQLNAS